MTPPASLESFLNAAWSRLSRGVADPKSACNRPTLATTGPEMRTVVLRAANRDAGTLDIHSHAQAGKITQIAADPAVALHVWDARANLQIRLRGRAELHIGTPLAKDVESRLPARTHEIYRISQTPGAIIPSPEVTRFDGPPAFALIRVTLDQIELLHLDRSRHSRALFCREDGWTGSWRAP
ncbi:pyridoxamine 5'-phosphate oxidase family protein [Pontivivens insulae]|uniref:Pyridoxamine 5'-phosphate oxidase Alr4036 family FMN-binding domain-containing protein n=1 Tax=Pontivivens insulae TaxID=1639689 RepID=A0A2R8ADV6_9RHOB|nr:pyridoxamine 5'-phosphate oxidase family protein [Pontivivens insulae]RED14360.1 pyridoxine/pyridoxamine 5'-phosphate oxidase [Pontivivens insulae]SPF30437.1 hypothetical protein POI8812_02774 [Pontivivens insulae]